MESETESKPLIAVQPAPQTNDESLPPEKDKEEETNHPTKKAKTMNGDMRRVAEIVLVLSAMAGIRGGGKKATETETSLMSEARSRLAEVCKDFAPKDFVSREAIGAVIEDLGLNWKVKDQRLGVRGPSRLSIKDRIAIAAKKVEEAKKLAASSQMHTSSASQLNFGQMPAHSRLLEKSMNVQSGVFSPTHLPDARLPSSSTVREPSNLSFARPERSQGNFASSSFSNDSGIPMTISNDMGNLHSSFQGGKYAQPSAHSEIAKIVMNVLHPRVPEYPQWTPPSREYMNRTVTCQICKAPVSDTESVMICDSCEKGFHVKCLEGSNQKVVPRAEWHCSKCLALSNGKPLPPKYGRVMRSLTSQKGNTNPPLAQQPQPQQLNQEKQVMNLPIARGPGALDNNDSSTQKLHSDEECSSPIPSTSSPKENPLVVDGNITLSSASDHVQESEKNQSEESKPSSENPVASEKRDSAELESFGCLQNVEWVGNALRVLDGKTYYHSCCIGGVTYVIYDYALVYSKPGCFAPSRLQAMWEDNRTALKWLSVKQCYFPADLPESVVCPASADINEVYESNHESNVMAGLLKGTCEVLSPAKFEEKYGTKGSLHEVQPIFLCKWLYDEVNKTFQPNSA